MPTDIRLKIMLAITVAAFIVIFTIAPIAQDPSYHNFADQRSLFGIDNFFNVLSNLPFMIIGIIGIRLVASGRATGGLRELQKVYLIFFVGVFFTGCGSGYYHLSPNNQTLVWDRLPMTIAFMALFSAILGEYVSVRMAWKLFVPLLIAGVASVIYWHDTEQNGHGDLRPYALVQFLPILLIPLILWLFDSTLNNQKYIWGVIAAYTLSKLAEHFDSQIFDMIGFSGHSLKHLAAASGTLIFYWALSREDISLTRRN